MCGRTACTLNPDTLRRACGYKDALDKQRLSRWIKGDVEYVPSTNIGPKEVLPCLVAGSHFGVEEDRVLCAMMWSMIPPWHEGDYRKNSLSTHNARLENLNSSKLYVRPLSNGQRCVVVCEGYYEWKVGSLKKDRKQPYYIYPAQEKGVKADDPSTWKDEWSKDDDWKGLKVLKMAGIFNTFKTAEGKEIFSCSVITTDANNVLSWLHSRAPVILKNEKDVQVWLNKKLPVNEAICELKKLTLSEGDLSWHKVSTAVNNVSCKTEDCRKETKEEKKNSSSSFMASWLKKGFAEPAKRKDVKAEKDEEPNEKKSKKE